ncbi:MAG: MarR family winged helix-turn-helix transcriptional regulator [Cellulosilyticaceae bacterium]
MEYDLKHYGIGIGQLQILMLLYAHTEQSFSQNEFSKILDIDKGNISRNVAKLLNKEYLELDSGHSRKYRLSEKGSLLKTEIISSFFEINRLMTFGIEEHDLKQTVLILTEILKNLETTKR